MLTTKRTPSSPHRNVQDTHHHHGDPDAYGADDVELVVEDLFDGLRAGLRGTNQDPGHTRSLLTPPSSHSTCFTPRTLVVPEKGKGTGVFRCLGWWIKRRTKRGTGGGSHIFG